MLENIKKKNLWNKKTKNKIKFKKLIYRIQTAEQERLVKIKKYYKNNNKNKNRNKLINFHSVNTNNNQLKIQYILFAILIVQSLCRTVQTVFERGWN